MFRVSRPDASALDRWLAAAEREPLPDAPTGWEVRDHSSIVLGRGERTFVRGREAIAGWEMFHFGWVEIVPPRPPIRIATTVGVLARTFGLWSLNPCRIVAVIEDHGPIERFGFVYRTLPGHAQRGEERFLVEWSRSDDRVRYDLRARSRPGHALVWLGFPVARLIQRRFARDSRAAMRRAVGTSTG